MRILLFISLIGGPVKIKSFVKSYYCEQVAKTLNETIIADSRGYFQCVEVK